MLVALTQTLAPALAAQMAQHLRDAGVVQRTTAGERYASVNGGPLVEVAAGTTRHAVVVLRPR